MITGVPAEARWIRPEPRRTLPSSLVGRIVRLAFPQCSVVNAQPLTDELRNANFRLRLDSTPEFIGLRIYEHDASLCQKELDLLCLLAGSVPVPEVLHAALCGWEGIPPFALTSQGLRP